MDLASVMERAEQEMIGVGKLGESEQQALLRWGLRMFGLGQHHVEHIEEILLEGQLVLLEDGSRWRVSESDAFTSDLWLPGDKVVIIDNQMYKLDELEQVYVEPY